MANRPLYARVADRAHRLQHDQPFAQSVELALQAARAHGIAQLKRPLYIRKSYSYLDVPIPDRFSDKRSAPPRSLRPPATRIGSSRGAALRLHLMVLADVQTHTKAGTRPTITRKIDSTGGWIDVVASDAVLSISNSHVMVRDKKKRTVTGALKKLKEAGLIELPNLTQTRDKFDGFVLLDESGSPSTTPKPYTVPTAGPMDMGLPPTLITEGWVHLLEDSELAVLMMVQTAFGNVALNEKNQAVAVSGTDRLMRYGIPRDAFSDAVKVLEGLGLLEVDRRGRHSDGKAAGGEEEAMLFRLKLVLDGFDQPAPKTALKRFGDPSLW